MNTRTKSSSTRRPENNSRVGIMAPPDLGRIMDSLARNTREAMAALYDLQTALINATTRTANYETVLKEYRKTRDYFRFQWEKTLAFIQSCCMYAEDFISLSEFATTSSPSECLAFLTNILTLAKSIYRDITLLEQEHVKGYTEFSRYRKSLNFLFKGKTLPPQETRRHAPSRSETLDSQFVQVSLASLHPDGAHSYASADTSLNGINTALKDLVIFWKGEMDEVVLISSDPNALSRFAPSQFKAYGEKWRRYKSALLEADSLISESSDALSVDAVGASIPKHEMTSRVTNFRLSLPPPAVPPPLTTTRPPQTSQRRITLPPTNNVVECSSVVLAKSNKEPGQSKDRNSRLVSPSQTFHSPGDKSRPPPSENRGAPQSVFQKIFSKLKSIFTK